MHSDLHSDISMAFQLICHSVHTIDNVLKIINLRLEVTNDINKLLLLFDDIYGFSVWVVMDMEWPGNMECPGPAVTKADDQLVK